LVAGLSLTAKKGTSSASRALGTFSKGEGTNI
jgi:hypothetical protein